MVLKKHILSGAIAVLLLSLVVAISEASHFVAKDGYFDTDTPGNHDGNELHVRLGGFPTCNFTDTDVSYITFSLTGITQTIGRAELVLTTTGSPTSLSTVSLGLYQVADDSWDEAAATSGPALGSLIQSVSLSGITSSGQTVTFGNLTGSSNLATYMESQKNGDGFATVALRLESCSFTSRVDFEDRTGSNPPVLNLQTPTSIALSNVAASDTAYGNISVWALALTLLALFSVTFVVFRRRFLS